MAGEVEEETEYESDPEETKISLKMRRREASDDEDSEGERRSPTSRSGIVDSEAESDGQGAAAEYDDEQDQDQDEDDEEYYDEQEVYEEKQRVVSNGQYEEEEKEISGVANGEGKVLEAKSLEGEDESRDAVEDDEGEDEGEREKKENEPFAVPTSGAFYLHDDRFKNSNVRGKHRTFGGRKVWESKDDRKWGHDKFEELDMEDRHRDEGRRSSKGFYRGRGRARGGVSGYARATKMRGYDDNNSQSAPPKDVRGRGPRVYQTSMKKRSEALPHHNRRSAKSLDKNSPSRSGRVAVTSIPNLEHEPVTVKKVASSLSSASPPFYPSVSSNKDNISLTQKKELQASNHNRNMRSSAVEHTISMQHTTSLMRGKNVIEAMGMDQLHIDDYVSPVGEKSSSNVHFPSSAPLSAGAIQMTQSRPHGRGVPSSGSTVLQSSQTNNQLNKISSSAAQASQRIPVQIQGHLQAPGQELARSRTSSPLKAGKVSSQGIGRGALVYGGAQVMAPGGNAGAGHGDANLPTFLPVMQFGGQQPGGIPAVGMAFPGYVAQPNGLGNSEMTWLPVLASAAGALGASYCPPYIAVDGSYSSCPTGQTSALPAPSKDNNLSKVDNELKTPQRFDVANDKSCQRQNKPRRYSAMNFSQ